MAIKKCKYCKKEFASNIGGTKYCSEECRQKASYKGTLCKVCGKPTQNNRATCSSSCLEKWRIVNNSFSKPETQQKIKNSFIEKYGVDNPMKCNSIKNQMLSTRAAKDNGNYYDNWVKKSQATMKQKYGAEHALQAEVCKKKLEETIKKSGKSGRFHTKEWNEAMLKKYGTTVSYKNNKIKSKGIQTLLDRYGVSSPAKLDFVKEKMKKTCLEKYGVEYVFQDANFHTRARQTLIDKYGTDNNWLLPKKTSKLNQYFGKLLNVDEYEFPIGLKKFDLRKGDTLIEINPFITHNVDKDFYFGVKDKNYHFEKTQLAINNGYRCFNIWDWDNINIIESMFTTATTKIGARKCDVVLIDKITSDNFMDTYHLQGKCSGDKVRVGLVFNDELVSVMSFGDSRYSNKFQIELLRYCTKFNYNIIGGANKLFSFFVSNFNPESIISYCDNSKFTGDTYLKLGFNKISSGVPTAHWYNPKSKKHFTDNLLRQLGADALIGTNLGKGTNNNEIMLNAGYVRIYDCGQSSFGWYNVLNKSEFGI